MLVTLADGKTTLLYDTETNSVLPDVVYMGKHHLRLHIYDPRRNTASEKFVTYDKALQDKIIKAIIANYGYIDHGNTWIRFPIKRQEFWDVSDEKRMVTKDLQRYFGNNVSIRGIVKRYIWYISDGYMSTTADAIGKMFNKPLVFKGLAMATVFDIAGKDPLSPGKNVVHWLTKSMWHGFHDRFRKVPKDFPWPTGFVATYWCQREGYGSYGRGGIRIASMTQSQTVGSWANTSLRQYWVERQGKDIFQEFGMSFNPKVLAAEQNKKKAQPTLFKYRVRAAAGLTPYGLVGLYCTGCNSPLSQVYGRCKICGYYNEPYYIKNRVFCTRCGQRQEKLCQCGDLNCSSSAPGCTCKDPMYVTMSTEMHSKQHHAFMYSGKGSNVGYKSIVV